MSTKNVGIIGTVLPKKFEKCPVTETTDVKKENRGYCDYQYDSTNKVIIVRWHDNSVVTVAYNTAESKEMVRKFYEIICNHISGLYEIFLA